MQEELIYSDFTVSEMINSELFKKQVRKLFFICPACGEKLDNLKNYGEYIQHCGFLFTRSADILYCKKEMDDERL